MNRMAIRAIAGVTGVVSAAGMAFGQAEPPKPPPIADMGSPLVILYYLIGFAGIAVCVMLAAFPGRRSFED